MPTQIPFQILEENNQSWQLQDFIFSNPMALAGPGKHSDSVEAKLNELIGCNETLLTPSGTSALELIAILLDVGPGDEVIMPSWTFSSTANAFILRGAKIVFVDIELQTLNMNIHEVEDAITNKTKVIVTINYGGLPGELLQLHELTKKYGIELVEDNAHGLGGSLGEKKLGSFGSLSALSFHQTKNLQCGEGGALVINDPSYAGRAEIIREKGTDRSAFFRGEVDKYTWRDLGMSAVVSEILAAYLESNLNTFAASQAKRRQVWDLYQEGLADWALKNEVMRPDYPPEVTPAFHAYWLILPSLEQSKTFISYLRDIGIGAARHYVPLHSAPAASKYGSFPHSKMENTNIAGSKLVRLPLYSQLDEATVERVVTAIEEFAF